MSVSRHPSTIGAAARPRRLLRAALIATATAFITTTFAAWFAPADAVPRAVRRACKTDYKRICPHYRAGTAKMRSCMRANVGQISPRCYNKLVDYGYGGSRAKRSRARSRSRRRR